MDECGPGGNALSQLARTALNQRPAKSSSAGPSSSHDDPQLALARSRQQRPHEQHLQLAREFELLQKPSAGPSSAPGQPALRTDPFRFTAVNRELEALRHGPAEPSAAADWSSEFHTDHHAAPDPHFAEFERAFEGPPKHAWASEFATHHHHPIHQHVHEDPVLMDPAMAAHFDEAFERAKQSASWESQFASTAADGSKAWESEFKRLEEQQASTTTLDTATEDAADVSNVAGILLDAVNRSANPKLRESKFVNFIQKLKDKELAIEGNKIVQNVAPAEQRGSKEFADEFLASQQHVSESHATLTNGISTTSWEEDFMMSEGAPLPNAQLQHASANGEASWANEFASSSSVSGKSSAAVATDGGAASTTAGEWLQEFSSASGDQAVGREKYDQDWAESFKSQLHELAKEDPQGDGSWEALSRAWDMHMQQTMSSSLLDEDESILPNSTTAGLDPRFSEYAFTANNPYMSNSFSQEFLQNPMLHKNLTESILALEAAVQRDPSNAAAWRMLGMKQQENENDVPAIAALRKCLELMPNDLQALFALSVAYTNENYVHEAYAALGDWIIHNPKYSHHLSSNWMVEAGISLSDRHTFLTDKLISIAGTAAAAGEELDENIQAALGVLYNISSEYSKAVDCFEAALSKRPDDYMLWNRLGATLANSYQPRRAMDAYFNALQINPAYVRARYNLAIACIQIGQHREAAEHLLGALSVQQQNLMHVLDMSSGKGKQRASDDLPESALAELTSAQSNTVWSSLRLLMDTYMNRKDLSAACDRRDLTPFHADFDF